jgi:hypothetical protein
LRNKVTFEEKKNKTKEGKYGRRYKTVGGHALAQLVETLRHKPEGRGFDSRWSHGIFH